MILKKQDNLECPNCGEIEFEHLNTAIRCSYITLEYECTLCHEIGFFDETRPEVIFVKWEREDELEDR